MDLGLRNKSVIVTGGGSNIGRAIVLGFASEGANITIGDIDAGQAEDTAKLAREQGAASCQVVKTDVTDLASVQAMFKAATDKFGSVDVLVNNVGWDKLMFFTQTDPEFWRKVININFVGNLNCTKTALEIMIPKNTGSIVSISSDASRQGELREAVYGGMKAAVNSFTKTVARENGRYGIRCNVVCPGVTIPKDPSDVGGSSMWSNMADMFTPDQLEKVAKALPLRTIGHPEDIVGAVMFLSSRKVAGYITGQVLSVSGGYSMIG
ncbi:SDR family oxidoreductase [Mesorhizobium sp.]|uniref:SDR family NAD(P)-dependent oxidoreductase n=1 Tax=Mesorhizobium sp. TaxID=1871066 RepID=UPI0025F46B6B|nr:SDR family oxidoreductase [Mesorhizobium sp.]